MLQSRGSRSSGKIQGVDLVTIVLCMCIGNVVAWLIALYTERGMEFLIWNVVLGSTGAALCGGALAWLALPFGLIWLLIFGPLCALFAIRACHTARRAF